MLKISWSPIVGDQAVTARNQLKAELALAEAGVARYQHADAEHIHEHAMHDDALRQLLRQIHTQVVDHLRRRQRRGKQRDVLFVANGENVGRRFEALRDDQRRRPAGDQFANDVAARTRFQAVIVIQFLVAEDLDAAGVDQVQVADLVGGGSDIARNEPIAAGEAGKPAELEAFAVIVVQPLNCQRCLQH